MRSFEKGDKVWITMMEPGEDIYSYPGPYTVLSMPCDVGDLLYLEDAGGRIIGLNPGSSAFVAIELDCDA